MISEGFAGWVLAFGSAAAVAFAGIFVDRQVGGRPISLPDCQIAATARVHATWPTSKAVASI